MERSADRWTPVAMVRITLWLVLGVFIAQVFLNPVKPLYGLAPHHRLICHMLWGIIAFGSVMLRHQRSAGYGVFRLAGIALTGFMLAWTSDDRLSKHHISHLTGKADAVAGIVARSPVKVSSGFRTLVIAGNAHTGSGWQTASGRIAVYALDSTLLPGDHVLIKGTPITFRENMNPEGINTAALMAKNNVYIRIKTAGRSVIRLPNTPDDGTVLIKLFRWSAIMREACIKRLSVLSESKADRAVTEALVLGVTSGLDPEVAQPFASTGTLHVLAVSGMHVGIIYAIILVLLSPLTFWSGNRWTTAGISLLLLWFYALITGLSPSVLRAVVMFSLMTAARPFGVRTNIWNTLAASVFLLILSDPFLISRIGFLLSYLAVAGIVWIAPMLSGHWEPENKVMVWIWTTLCVTTAAQILTMPVTLACFGKLPVYFLPANLIIIPLSTIALVLSLAGLVLGDVHVVLEILRFLHGYALKAMTGTALFFEHLPGSVVTVGQISPLQGFLWLGMIIAFVFFVRHRRVAAGVMALLLAFFGTVIDWTIRFNESHEATMTVYHWPGKTIMAIRANRSLTVLAAQDPLAPDADVPQDVANGLMRRPADNYRYLPDSIGAARFKIENNEWMYLNGTLRKPVTAKFIILGSRATSSLGKNCADVLIAGSSTYLKQPAADSGCINQIHHVRHGGAYISRVPVSGAGDD